MSRRSEAGINRRGMLRGPDVGGAELAGSGFRAGTVADLALWLRGDSYALNGPDVQQLDDRSGNGRHFVQALASSQPAWEATGLGGRPCVQFDGVDERLEYATPWALTAAEVFVVGKLDNDPPTGGNTGGFWEFGSAVQQAHVPFTDGAIYDEWGTNTRTDSIAVNPRDSLSSSFLYSVVSASGEWTSRVNGSVLTSRATNGVAWSAAFWLGASNNTGTPSYLAGRIAELLVYARKLTATERVLVRQYLTTRYGLSGIVYPENQTPFALTGLRVWLRSDFGLGAGTGIASWASQAPTLPHLRGLQGTGANQPTYAAGPPPYLQFDGTNDFFLIADDAATSPTAGWSIYADVYQDATTLGVSRYISTKTNATATNAPHLIRVDNNNLSIFVGSAAALGATPAAGWSSAARHRVLIVYDGTGATNADRLRVWLDGVAQTLTFTGVIPATVSDTIDAISVGAFNGSASFWNGRFYEYQFHNRALTAGEITTLLAYTGPT